MPLNTYAHLEHRFSEWALTQPLIEAVIVVGSRARSNHPADEWSDLDLVVFARDTSYYLNEAAWLNELGPVRIAIAHSFGKNDREWLALYEEGIKLDIAVLSIAATAHTLQEMLDAFPYPVVVQRGVRVIVDKTDSSTALRLPELTIPQPPDQAEFTALINRMWLDSIKTAKFIRRADLWRAKQLCDGELKQYLLALLEWQAAVHPDRRDIWYDGRFLSEWADPLALAKLPETFARYEAGDVRRALLATLDLGRRLAQEIANRLSYAYPLETDHYVMSQIDRIFAGSHQL
jgi:aminoglycoside 6-adenylyltransferase